MLSNSATADGYARAIVTACEAAGIGVEIVGLNAGNPSDTPELLIPAYDLVFAKGRTVLEAVAVGCAVVLADALTREPTIAGALGRYEAQRLGRANRFVVRSMQMGQLAHVRGRPLRWLRDHALRMIPAKLAARSLARELDFHV